MNDPVEVPEQSSTPLKTNPYVGIFAVFLGAGLATLNSRLLSVGLADLRGALGLALTTPPGSRPRSIWQRCSAASSSPS